MIAEGSWRLEVGMGRTYLKLLVENTTMHCKSSPCGLLLQVHNLGPPSPAKHKTRRIF
jgi:hypothetical protein